MTADLPPLVIRDLRPGDRPEVSRIFEAALDGVWRDVVLLERRAALLPDT